jgi:hypothetical protein
LVLDLEFAVENALAKDDAVVADVDTGSGDELAHFRVGFPTETAHCNVVWPGHVKKLLWRLTESPPVQQVTLFAGIFPARDEIIPRT